MLRSVLSFLLENFCGMNTRVQLNHHFATVMIMEPKYDSFTDLADAEFKQPLGRFKGIHTLLKNFLVMQKCNSIVAYPLHQT